ncbi:MAG: WavE lipopolysaccharide synthesis family protein, partial [Shewanella sp.]
MINDISFIIQGNIQKTTTVLINSLADRFPQSEIIVSTTSPIKDPAEIPPSVKVIVNSDPGFFYYSKKSVEKINNINRQIVSTLAGLKKASKPYAFKIRSDFILTGDDFLAYFDRFPLYEDSHKIFTKKIIACTYFSRRPVSDMPHAYHPSDLAFFGLTEDLINLFDIPLMTEDEAYWDKKNSYKCRFVPEQHLFIKCLEK